MHLKRQKVSKIWPVPRKGTKYLVVPSHNKKQGIPLLVLLRDVLKIAKNRKETKKILNEGKIIVNSRIRRDEKFPLVLFDILEIKSINKFYMLSISKNKKFILQEVNEKEKNLKTSKVANKKILKKKIVQLNLMGGNNVLRDASNAKINPNDSIILNMKENKIVKVLPLRKGSKVFVMKGKHAGNYGKIINIENKKNIEIKLDEEKKVKLNLENIIVVK